MQGGRASEGASERVPEGYRDNSLGDYQLQSSGSSHSEVQDYPPKDRDLIVVSTRKRARELECHPPQEGCCNPDRVRRQPRSTSDLRMCTAHEPLAVSVGQLSEQLCDMRADRRPTQPRGQTTGWKIVVRNKKEEQGNHSSSMHKQVISKEKTRAQGITSGWGKKIARLGTRTEQMEASSHLKEQMKFSWSAPPLQVPPYKKCEALDVEGQSVGYSSLSLDILTKPNH